MLVDFGGVVGVVVSAVLTVLVHPTLPSSSPPTSALPLPLLSLLKHGERVVGSTLLDTVVVMMLYAVVLAFEVLVVVGVVVLVLGEEASVIVVVDGNVDFEGAAVLLFVVVVAVVAPVVFADAVEV